MDVEQREHVVSGFASIPRRMPDLRSRNGRRSPIWISALTMRIFSRFLPYIKKRWKTGCSALRWDWST